MITVTCDMCGEKLGVVNNLVNVEFTYDGLIALGRGAFHDTKKTVVYHLRYSLASLG